MTITLQIGNSDDKLTQAEWHTFFAEVDILVQKYASVIHFSGTSNGAALWQNACWVFEAGEHGHKKFVRGLVALREKYAQEAIAVTAGETSLI